MTIKPVVTTLPSVKTYHLNSGRPTIPYQGIIEDTPCVCMDRIGTFASEEINIRASISD